MLQLVNLKKINKSHSRRSTYGAAVVEMALIAPILILLLFSIVQYGLILNTIVTISQFTRDGARFAAVHVRESTSTALAVSDGGDSKSIKTFIKRECDASSINWNDIKNN